MTLRVTFLLIGLFLISNVQATIIIPGKVNNPIDSTIKLILLPTEIGGQKKEIIATLNDNNAFQFEIESDVPILADVFHGAIGFPIFINPNRLVSFHLTVETVTKGRVQFKGPGKVDNTFYLAYQTFVNTKLENRSLTSLKNSKSKEFMAFVDRRKAGRSNFVQTYLTNNEVDLSPELQKWVDNDIIYESGELLLKYPQLYYIANRRLKRKDLPKKYYTFLEEIPINNESAILQPTYLGFLEGYFFNYRIEKSKDWQTISSYKNQIKYVERFFFGSAKFYLQSIILLDAINDNPRLVEDEYRQFITSKAAESLKNKVKARYNKTTAPLKGKSIPIEAMVDI